MRETVQKKYEEAGAFNLEKEEIFPRAKVATSYKELGQTSQAEVNEIVKTAEQKK